MRRTDSLTIPKHFSYSEARFKFTKIVSLSILAIQCCQMWLFQTWCRAIKVYYFDILAITTTCTVRKTPGLNDSLWHLASSSTFIPKRVILDKGRKVISHSLFQKLLYVWILPFYATEVYSGSAQLCTFPCILWLMIAFWRAFFENAHYAKCGCWIQKSAGIFKL